MKINLILLTVFSLLMASCTPNARAKNFGGTLTVELPPSTKLVNATWKESELWYLYRDRRVGEQPENSTFAEQSNFGVWQGQVVFHEK